MPIIHLIGSEGFIGRAVQHEAGEIGLHCWSHRQSDLDHYFDLLDPATWQNLLQHQPTHVILLSWPGLPNYNQTVHLTTNLTACIDLFEKLLDVGLKRLVVAGTCYEYGMQNGPLREDQFTDPVNCYAIAKDSLRRVIASRCSQQDVEWCWLRIFYPHGQGQNSKSLLPSLANAIQKGADSFDMSSGRQLRDFISVNDVARQLLLLTTHPNAMGIYNGGSGDPRSIAEIAEELIHELHSSIVINRGVYPDRTDEPLAFWAQMDKLAGLHKLCFEGSDPIR